MLSLGDDVQRKESGSTPPSKRLKNFATVVLQRNRLLLYLHLDPKQVVARPAECTRRFGDRPLGHREIWNLHSSTLADLDTAKPLIAAA